jgi:hypothetical protein
MTVLSTATFVQYRLDANGGKRLVWAEAPITFDTVLSSEIIDDLVSTLEDKVFKAGYVPRSGSNHTHQGVTQVLVSGANGLGECTGRVFGVILQDTPTNLADGRVCTRCGDFMSWENFGKDTNGRNGRRSMCKVCIGLRRLNPAVFKRIRIHTAP